MYRSKIFTCVFMWSLLLVTSCSSIATKPSNSVAPNAQPTSTINKQAAWQETRRALPADVTVYAPVFIPNRFNAPSMEEARVDSKAGPVYTIIYSSTGETIAFVHNLGKGAWANTLPPQSQTTTMVNNVKGNLWVSEETHHLGVSWRFSCSVCPDQERPDHCPIHGLWYQRASLAVL